MPFTDRQIKLVENFAAADMTSINHSDRFLHATASPNGDHDVRLWLLVDIVLASPDVRCLG
jgi:hypothetical protein